MLSPEAIADTVGTAWGAYLAKQSRAQTPHRYVYASSWRTCERRMVYDCVQPERLPPWPVEVLAKFRRGDDRERDLLADLGRIGRDADPPFTIIGQQERFELKDHKSRVAIVGKVDARIEIETLRAPLEVKSWAPYLTDRIEIFADVFENLYTRGGGYQLLSYLYGAGEPYGFLLLDRSGLPRLLPVELDRHLDRMEEFLARAERVLDHVEAGTLPDYLHDDSAECHRCAWFGHTCNPPFTAQVAQVLTDPDLEADLERREALKEAAREFDALDSDLKKRLRGVESGIAGAFQITGRWGKFSYVPDDSKKAFDEMKKKFTVTDPKGRFTLDITRV